MLATANPAPQTTNFCTSLTAALMVNLHCPNKTMHLHFCLFISVCCVHCEKMSRWIDQSEESCIEVKLGFKLPFRRNFLYHQYATFVA